MRPELILMDDGFQHLSMDRDLDLVLLRPEDLGEQWNRVIPAGSWREPPSALDCAGAFLVKCPPDAAEALMPLAAQRLERFGKPVFTFSLSPLDLRQVDGEGVVTPAEVNSRPYMLVTGVGEPEQVKATVTAYMGYGPDESMIHPDHHRFTFREVEAMAASRKPVICTAKDAAKMRLFPCANVWYLRTDLQFGPSLWTDLAFPDWWNAWWQNWKPSSRKR
jgi:tetraacyldisaccharide 4'-kinase